MRKLSSITMLALVVPFLLQGCFPAFLAKPVNQEVAPGTILFSDDFSDPPGGWGTWNRPGALVEYRDGGLRIFVDDTHYDFWSVTGKRFTDVQIEVDATMVDGPNDNDYGLICRYIDKENFYMLIISSDGYYGAARLKNGQYSMIGSDQLQYSSFVVQGRAVNHLRADCIGDRLSLYVNGQMLMEAQDAEFSSGDVGLIAGAYSTAGVDILFDNFVVKEPGE